MAMLCYVLAALCLVYCVGVVATKAAGTKFYLIWLAGTALFGLLGFFCTKRALDAFANRTAGGNRRACRRGYCLSVRSADPDRQHIFCKREQQLSYIIVLGAQMKQKRAQRRSGKTACVGHIPT